MKKIIILFNILFLISLNALDTRRMSLGESGFALIGDVGTIEVNPAGMAFRNEKDFLHLAINSQLYSSKLNLGNFYNLNFKVLYQNPFVACGMSLAGLKFRNIYSTYNANFSIAKSFLSQFSVGVKTHLQYHSFSVTGINSKFVYDFSPALLYNSSSRFVQIGLVVEKGFSSDENDQKIFNLGTQLNVLANLGVNLDYQYQTESQDKLSLGLEASFFDDVIILRTGLVALDEAYGLALGTAIQYNNLKFNYAVDFSPAVDVVNSLEFVFGI